MTELDDELAATKISVLRTIRMISQGVAFAIGGACLGYFSGGKSGAITNGIYAFGIYLLANMQKTGGIVPSLDGLKK